MEIFDVFSMNGIENYPAGGENFLENVILKVSQTHFSKDFYPKGGGINFSRGGRGAVNYPEHPISYKSSLSTQALTYLSPLCVSLCLKLNPPSDFQPLPLKL